MQFQKLSQRLSYLEELIKKGATGTPDELANKLGVSRRTIMYYLDYLRNDRGLRFEYCKDSQSYKAI